MIYDKLDFEQAIDYFQNVLRIKYHPHDFDSIETEGLDHCYYYRAETFILEKHLTKTQSIENQSELKNKMAELSYDISRNIYEYNQNIEYYSEKINNNIFSIFVNSLD